MYTVVLDVQVPSPGHLKESESNYGRLLSVGTQYTTLRDAVHGLLLLSGNGPVDSELADGMGCVRMDLVGTRQREEQRGRGAACGPCVGCRG